VHIDIYLSLDFPHRILQRDIRDMKFTDSISSKLSHWVIVAFHSIKSLDPLFFHL
jgi:hypothetical protein